MAKSKINKNFRSNLTMKQFEIGYKEPARRSKNLKNRKKRFSKPISYIIRLSYHLTSLPDTSRYGWYTERYDLLLTR